MYIYTYAAIIQAPTSTQEPQPDARQMQDGRRPLKCTNPVDFHLVPKVKISLTRQGGILHFLSDFFPAELDKFVFLGHPKISQFPTPFIFNFSSILPSYINPSPLFLHHLLSNSSLISPFCSSSASL